ncbi:MAG: hypothetical protein J0M04_24000 [Verrucomicrobia bacterium]|nr:hypothetical protein [Verrucomicrobiota bacterium]
MITATNTDCKEWACGSPNYHAIAIVCLILVFGCESQNKSNDPTLRVAGDVKLACEDHFKLPIEPGSIVLSSESEALRNVFGVPRIEDIAKSDLANVKCLRIFREMAQKGHQVWHFDTASKTWEELHGRKGYVTWNGKEITSVIIWMMN